MLLQKRRLSLIRSLKMAMRKMLLRSLTMSLMISHSACVMTQYKKNKYMKDLCLIDFEAQTCWINKPKGIGLSFEYFKDFRSDEKYYLIRDLDLEILYSEIIENKK